MRSAAVIVALAAGATAMHAGGNNTISYTTEVVTAYTTFCPSSTTVVHGSQTYTVSEATTLTVTNCPCTVTMPVVTSPVVYCSTCSATSSPVETHPAPVETHPAPVGETPVAPIGTNPGPILPGVSSAPYPTTSAAFHNSTAVAPTGVAPTGSVPAGSAPVGTAPGGSATSTESPAFTGAANKMAVSGASLAGLLGLAAYLL